MKNKRFVIRKLYVLLFSLFAILFSFNIIAKAETVEKYKRSIFRLEVETNKNNKNQGVAFAIGKPGKSTDAFVTSADVVKGASKIKMLLYDGSSVYMNIDKSRIYGDLAVLIINDSDRQKDFKPILLGNSDSVKIGHNLAALGYNIMNSGEQLPDLSAVTVSNVDYENHNLKCAEIFGNKYYEGAPVLDKKNSVVGVITTYTSTESTITSINYLYDSLDHSMYSTVFDIQLKMILIAVAVVILLLICLLVVILVKRKGNANSHSASKVKSEFINSGKSANDGRTIAIVPEKRLNNKVVIVGREGYFLNQSFDIGDKLVIGRDPKKANVVFPPKTQGVSAVHCEIRNINGNLELIDLGSTYGTFLGNGSKCNASIPYALNKGDEFYLGARENRFVIGG